MRYMLIMSAPESMAVGEPDAPVDATEAFEMMGRYNTALVEAGVLLAAEGLAPSAEGFEVTHDGEGVTVTDGPFTEAKELVAGFWILDVATRAEAEQWARQCPIGPGVRLEVRRIPDMREFEGIAPAEVLDAEASLRARINERGAERSRSEDTERAAEQA
ncbi:YciI family protein [Actinomycetospora termitidis]|uniref:YciI family protein n=1 Tax=Actinomycetospora termitidis TaxID=3053470 RepID=A0ABT7MB89_9PSEU|nr:YciI family protein [Actinomycetospora sp. Odt1-22]MDL5157927.1 YciI family protein [Actinomycetospora sp. Odt1-22]